ncbi:MAG: hypothetical protein GXY08_02945 [Ruminococcus sp.]|nr:hypothetical protein [Ruminococcus sp.]
MKKIVSAIAAAALAAVTFSCGTGRKSEVKHMPYEAAINNYCTAMTKADPDALMECTLPAEAASAAKADPDHGKAYEDGKKSLSAVREGWVKNCGNDPVMSLGEIKSSVELTEPQIRGAEAYLAAAAAEYGVKDLSPHISEGYEAVLTLNITGADYETSMENTCCMVNIDGDGWKIITTGADSFDNNAG